MGVRGEIFSTRVMLANRTYFFNVKENRMGDLYLNIVESKNRDSGGFERQSVILFADDLQEFLKGFDESLRVLEKAAREKKNEKYGEKGTRRHTPDEAPHSGVDAAKQHGVAHKKGKRDEYGAAALAGAARRYGGHAERTERGERKDRHSGQGRERGGHGSDRRGGVGRDDRGGGKGRGERTDHNKKFDRSGPKGGRDRRGDRGR